MRFHFAASLSLLLLGPTQALGAANERKLNENLRTCLPDGEFDPDVDYFPEKYIPRQYFPNTLSADDRARAIESGLDNTTDLLTIEYFDTYKIVTNKFVNTTYLLYQCGTEPPADQLDGRHHLVLRVPHEGGIVITETPQIAPLEILGLRDQIIGYAGNPIYVTSPCMRHRMDVDMTIEVIFDENDPWNATRSGELLGEFLDRNPDALVFGGPYAGEDRERVLTFAATQERTNVATFDWIALHAALFNLEGRSNIIAAETKERYECSSRNARILSADLAEDERPVVLWATYFLGYNWSVAECPTWDHAYYCEYANHCGANILGRPEGVGFNDPSFGGNFWYLNDDELLELGRDADIFFYASNTWDTVYESKRELLDQIKAVQNRQVYDIQGGGQFAWHEQRLGEYDVVGLDFCEIVGLANEEVPHNVRWFRNVFDGEIGDQGVCNVEEVGAPYIPSEATCIPLEEPSTSGAMSRSFWMGGILVGLVLMAL